MAYCLYYAFLNQNIEPGVFMGLRTRNDPIPDGERAFMLAAIKKALQDGDVTLKARNFSSKTGQKGG